MKRKHLLSIAISMLFAGIAYGGFVLPVPVDVNLVNMTAIGDQWAARSSANDIEFIGCGSRHFDDGTGNSFRFGFCQAGDADGDSITCFTQDDDLIDEMRTNSDYAFILFNWQDDGSGGSECTRVGYSTQSFYLPAAAAAPKRCDANGDDAVNIMDIRVISANRNQPATGPDDPMDWDQDGVISVSDARGCQRACDLPRCAVE
jgi:hypothetical protein